MNNTHGTWATVRLACGDGRLQRAILNYAESFGGLSDSVLAPGGVKKFLADEAYRSKMFEDIATYLQLHRQSVILVLQHEDCGAYGGKQAFPGDSAEKELQKQELKRAALLLRERFPDKRIVTGFISLDGVVEVFEDLAVVL